MPIQDIIQRVLSRTLPEEGELLRTPPIIEPIAPAQIKPIRSVNEPPSLEEEIYNTHQRALGLDQKFNADGTPRKKTWKEKLGAAAAIAMTGAGEFSRGARRNPKEPSFSELVEDQVVRRRDVGMKERIAKMQTDQRREASELAAEMKLAGIESSGNLKQQEIAIKAAKARGEISESQANAALLRVKAKQAEGIMDGSSKEGAAKLGLTQSMIDKNKATTDDLRNTPNQSLEQAIVAATKSGDTATLNTLRTLQDRMAQMKLAGKPIGSESVQEYNNAGQLVNTRKTLFRGAPQDSASPMNPPSGGGIAPRPPELPPEAELNRKFPPMVMQPTQTPSFVAPGTASAKQRNWYPEGKPAAGMNKKAGDDFITKRDNQIEALKTNNDFTNKIISTYVSKALDNFSDVDGTTMGKIIRGASKKGISPEEASVSRAQMAKTAAQDKADFGRVSNFNLQMETASQAQSWNSSKSKLAFAVADNYDKTISALAATGSPEQKAIAQEIVTDPKRRQAMYDSINDFIKIIDFSREAGKTPPKMSDNLYLLSRTDDELKQMFPNAKTPGQIALIRATGGKPESLQLNPKGSTSKKTKNDNEALGY